MDPPLQSCGVIRNAPVSGTGAGAAAAGLGVMSAVPRQVAEQSLVRIDAKSQSEEARREIETIRRA
jgi:hypothetical protein